MLLFGKRNKIPRMGSKEKIRTVLLKLLCMCVTERACQNAVPDFRRSGMGPEIVTSNKFPGYVGADGARASL